jgi:hypothetical protein
VLSLFISFVLSTLFFSICVIFIHFLCVIIFILFTLCFLYSFPLCYFLYSFTFYYLYSFPLCYYLCPFPLCLSLFWHFVLYSYFVLLSLFISLSVIFIHYKIRPSLTKNTRKLFFLGEFPPSQQLKKHRFPWEKWNAHAAHLDHGSRGPEPFKVDRSWYKYSMRISCSHSTWSSTSPIRIN